MVDDEELTAKGWVELPTKARSKAQRWDVLRNWVLGNGLLESVPDTHGMTEQEKTGVRATIFEAAERGISALRQKPTVKTISDSINSLIDGMRKRGSSESTIFGHRFKLVKFFRYMGIPQEVLGSERLDQMVRDVSAARATDDKLLNPDEIKSLPDTRRCQAESSGVFLRLHWSTHRRDLPSQAIRHLLERDTGES